MLVVALLFLGAAVLMMVNGARNGEPMTRSFTVQSWAQTGLVLIGIIIGLWQASLLSDRRMTTNELLIKAQEARITALEKIVQGQDEQIRTLKEIATRSQTLMEVTLKRHEQEDDRRFQNLGMGKNP